MIDVIIPAYNAHNTIKQTIYSLLIQSFKNNINVYIINDGSDKDYHEIVEPFKDYLNIKEYTLKKNSGAGAARNYGIKHSKSPYIVFLDSDDTLYNHYSLEVLYNAITKEKSDIVISSFLEEIEKGQYVKHSGKILWNHGKIYKREFIEKNNISFSKTKTNEDLYFNFLLHFNKPSVVYIDDVTYVWQNNSESLTRKNNREYNYKELGNYNDNIYNVCIEAEKRRIARKEIAKILFFGVLQMYYAYLVFLHTNNITNVRKLYKASKNVILKFVEYSNDLSSLDKNSIISGELSKYVNANLDIFFLPKKTFYEFIEEVKKYE